MALKLIPLFTYIITISIQALIISYLDQSISLPDSNPVAFQSNWYIGTNLSKQEFSS